MNGAQKRLSKELPTLYTNLPPGIALASADGFDDWFMDISVLDSNPLYKNQTYRLKFKFDSDYPFSASILPPHPLTITKSPS